MLRPILSLTFISVITLGTLHYLGSTFFLYWDVDWFDTLVHFIGGLAVGLIFLTIFAKKISSKTLIFSSTLFFVLLVGVGWEVFEYVFNIANPTGGNYVEDTTHDLIADIVGGFASAIMVVRKKLHV